MFKPLKLTICKHRDGFMTTLFSTREVAKFLDINEKMVYSLISDKGLPATKVTGKWLFPKHLVEEWIESNTMNYPHPKTDLPPYHGILIVAGSNDLLLDKALALFNEMYPEHVAVFGNLGSMGGIRALRRNLCHMATSHLLAEDEAEYNFDFARKELERMPAVVNFAKREQGILVSPENRKTIHTIKDLGKEGITVINRPLGTGTRLLFDRELAKAGLSGEKINGYQRLVHRHLDIGLEILSGRADAGPGIRPVAHLLGLSFIPLRWERFDLIIPKRRFFDQGVQLFINMLQETRFRDTAKEMEGYDLGTSGKMVFRGEEDLKTKTDKD